MKPRHLVLTQEEILLKGEFIQTIDQELTRNRLRAMLFYGTGKSVKNIREEVKCSRSSLMNWCQRYRLYGIQGLADGRKGGNNSKLSQEQVDDLAARLKQYTPKMILGDACSTPEGKYWKVKDTLRAIEVWYRVNYRNRSSYYNVLEGVDMKLNYLRNFSLEPGHLQLKATSKQP
jgi:transposase